MLGDESTKRGDEASGEGGAMWLRNIKHILTYVYGQKNDIYTMMKQIQKRVMFGHSIGEYDVYAFARNPETERDLVHHLLRPSFLERTNTRRPRTIDPPTRPPCSPSPNPRRHAGATSLRELATSNTTAILLG